MDTSKLHPPLGARQPRENAVQRARLAIRYLEHWKEHASTVTIAVGPWLSMLSGLLDTVTPPALAAERAA